MNEPKNQIGQDNPSTIVFFSNSGEDALAVLRVLGPAKLSGVKVVRGVEDKQVKLDRLVEGNCVVLQRDFPRDLNSYEKIITLAQYAKKPVILDLDDLLFELPENHPDRISHYFTGSLLPILQAIMEVDLLIVPTEALRAYLLAYNKNIIVFPNYLNDDLWRLREPVSNDTDDGIITIGYMGGHAHKPDLESISAVLVRIHQKYQSKIKFHFWGIEPPSELAVMSQVDWCPPKAYNYADFAAYFQTQTADIMIAPLVDNLFNSSKSSIKYLEYSAIGIPGVYSAVVPYIDVIDNGEDGFLARNDDEWERYLSTLIEDKNLRLQIAHNAQNKIRKHWLLSQYANKYKSICDHATIKQNGESNKPSPFHEIVKSIARQVYDEYGESNLLAMRNTIKSLEGQISQLSEERDRVMEKLNESEEEILDYVLSTSWQITRPLRKISSNLSKVIR